MLFVLLVVGGDGKQVDVPILGTLRQHFLVEVEFLSAVILVERVQESNIIAVRVRVSKCEFDFVVFVLKEKLETTLEFTIFSHDQWGFGRYPVPVGP